MAQIKSPAGFAKVSGVELPLLDSVRYFHRATGISGVAQIVQAIGSKADPRKLMKAAASYESSSVRRLGYLLDRVGHSRQSKALESFAKKAKTSVPLDPSVKPLTELRTDNYQKDVKWKLDINEPVDIDF